MKKNDISWKPVVAVVEREATRCGSDRLKAAAIAQIKKFLEKDFTESFSITENEKDEIAGICIQDTIPPSGSNKLFDTHILTLEQRRDFEGAFRKLLENESEYKLIVMLS
ncbi:MAG: hypothetical protein LBB21_02725 [Holosporaceae bacterium]|nr:hypothetical protein [Holosporaceae bacterium]